jgi:hypothetical protein
MDWRSGGLVSSVGIDQAAKLFHLGRGAGVCVRIEGRRRLAAGIDPHDIPDKGRQRDAADLPGCVASALEGAFDNRLNRASELIRIFDSVWRWMSLYLVLGSLNRLNLRIEDSGAH